MNKSDDVSAERIIREREPEHFMPTNSAAQTKGTDSLEDTTMALSLKEKSNR